MLGFFGCTIRSRIGRCRWCGRKISLVTFRICGTAAAVCLIATWLVAEDEMVASQIESAMLGLASSVQADIFEPQLLLRVCCRICHGVGERPCQNCRRSGLGLWKGERRCARADQKMSLAKMMSVRCQYGPAGCCSFGYILHPSMRRIYA